jgi:hypothetical protein
MTRSRAVIPAQAGIHFDRDLVALTTSTKSKVDSRLRGNDGILLACADGLGEWQTVP